MSEWQFTHIRVQVSTTRQTSNILALLLLPLLCAVGLLGNLLVCIAIYFDRRLHNVTNYFLFSLALADLLVCSIVMPLGLLVEVRHGVWTWSFSVCLLYVYSDVFLCTASIVHMSMISLDRFLGISKPLKIRHQSPTITTMKIAFVWLITVLISCPIAVAALYDPTNILQDNTCAISNRYYMVYGSTFAFLIPFIVMVVTYVKTTTLLNKQASQLSQRVSARSNGLRRTLIHRKLATSHAAPFPNGTLHRSATNASSYSSFRITTPPLFSEDEFQLITSSVDKQNAPKTSKLKRLKQHSTSVIYSLACRLSIRNSLQTTSQELANERKATRVLAVVFGCFFVCWTPFFAANFALGFCGNRCAAPPSVASLFLWLGYVSSTINPLIYTIFNRRFRQAFLRIIRCQCLHPLREFGSINYSRNNTALPYDTYTWSNVERTAAIGILRNGEHCSTNTSSTRSEYRKDSPSDSNIRSSRNRRATSMTFSERRPLICKKYTHSTVISSTYKRSANDNNNNNNNSNNKKRKKTVDTNRSQHFEKRQIQINHHQQNSHSVDTHCDDVQSEPLQQRSHDSNKYLNSMKRSKTFSMEELSELAKNVDKTMSTSQSVSLLNCAASNDNSNHISDHSSPSRQCHSAAVPFDESIFVDSMRETFL